VYLALDNLAQFDPELFFDSIDPSSLHVPSHDFNVALNTALRRDAFRFLGGVLQHFVQELLIRTHRHDAYLGPLPQILMVNLGNRHIEFCAQPVLQAAHNHSLVF
jgi:hypothetical protein